MLAIRAQNLGKQYHIGGRTEAYSTLRDTLMNAFARREPPRTIWALKAVSFEVQRGEVVGIIGRNGAGKSTLLKILSRITEPTEGCADVYGRVGSLLEVGTGFHPELTGRENVFLNGAILGMRRREIERKFDEIVAFAEVSTFIDTPVKHYSTGMGVRLGFAVAAHLEPEILIVDEVLTVGDAAFQKKSLGKIGEVASDGRTVILVSHNMASMRTLCDVVYWLDDGKLRFSGSANETVNAYEREALKQASEPISAIEGDAGLTVSEVGAFILSDADTTALRVEISGYAAQPLVEIGIGIKLTTLEGVLVFQIGPRAAGSIINNVSGEWRCGFDFPDITRYLGSGDYLVGVHLLDGERRKLLDIDHAARVSVPLADVYGNGFRFSAKRNGLVPLPFRFFNGER